MKILDRYLLRELIGPFFLAVVGFLIIMIADALYYITPLIRSRETPFLLVAKVLALKVPAILVLALPVAILFATLFSLGKLSRDTEITAIRMGKVSFYRIMLPFIFVGIIVSYSAFYLNERVVPFANHQSENIIRRLLLSQSFPYIQENIFFKGDASRFFFVRRYYKEMQLLEGILVYELSYDMYPRVLTAQKGYWRENKWHLQDGAVHKYDDKGYLVYEARFNKMEIHIDFNPVDFFGEQRTPQEMSSKELIEQIKIFQKGGIDTKTLQTDYYFKFSIPFACLIFVLIGAPLSVRFGRQSAVVGVILSIVLVFIYYVLMSASRLLGFEGIIPPVLAAWSQNILFGMSAIYIIWKVEH